MTSDNEKSVIWIGSCLDDLRAFPLEVQDMMGFALHLAQQGGKHPAAKPLKGHKGAGVLEIIDDYDGDTYRAVYTVRFEGFVYALHAFQKKSKTGIKTAPTDLRKIESRLKLAAADFALRKGKENG